MVLSMEVHRKKFIIPFFLHHINVRKRAQIIPHLRKRKIVEQW